MRTITWLHLSDLHFRATEQHTWDADIVLQSLLRDIETRIEQDSLRLDFIVVTGDIAFSGKAAEYDLASQFFDELLQHSGLGREQLFLVPGNHDVDRKRISLPAGATAKAITNRESANRILANAQNRQLMFARFEGYAAFVNNYFGEFLDFDKENYFYVHTLELAGKRLALLGLNSAWLAHGGNEDQGRLVLGERQVRIALDKARGTDLCLALMHHPFDWLRSFDRNDSESLLCEECDFVLHGHMHRVGLLQARTPDTNATIIAAGACYETREHPNSYNFVQLDLDTGKGMVFLRMYSDQRGGFWTQDVVNYKGAPGGRYRFDLGTLQDSQIPQPQPPPEPTHLPEVDGFVGREVAVKRPAFLEAEAKETEKPVFVARERELAWLAGFLEKALNGQGQMVFITGGPGRGKTALLNEFARQAMDTHASLLVASGNCNAYSGVGDPYLPFREVLGLLSGDVEARWAAGAISRRHARRLWASLPDTVQVLLDYGPHMIDGFVPGAPFLARASAAVDAPQSAPWLQRLRERVELGQPPAERPEQSYLFQQFTDVLRNLAEARPLFLILDDLQWADTASIGLLFHLGRRLAHARNRILLACAYRPEEVAQGREGQRHPLAKVLSEFKRQVGDAWLDLGQIEEAETQSFVDAFLDTQANRLGPAFRAVLQRHTGGHPLFTVELLRAMQQRGDLIQKDGAWVEGPSLDWARLPARIEAVIEERIGRLEPELRDILRVASVEGESFTAQVVARVQGLGERQLLHKLSQELAKRHYLVREGQELQIAGQCLEGYHFGHALFQQCLYNNLSAGERRLLHGEIGQILEELYAGHTAEIAVQLAHHFQQAALPEKAVDYWLCAGDRARALYAHTEAERFYLQAIDILHEQGRDELTARTLLKLGLVYTAAFDADMAQKTYDEAFALWQPLRESTAAPDLRVAPVVLRLGMEQPRTLDPGQIDDDISTFMAAQLFEGLVRVGPEHNVLPAVAARWEVADGGSRYLFYLRDGVRWNDGQPLTAGDFEYAWKRNLDPAAGSPMAHLLYPIANARAFGTGQIDDPQQVGVTALDDRTLEVCLEGPTAYLLYLLAQAVAYPLPRWAVEGQGQAWTEPGNLVTNGAYELAEREEGARLVLTRNAFYRGGFRGNAERVECPVVTDFATALEAYAADALDAVNMFNADPGTVARARATFGAELISIPQPSTFFLVFLAGQPPFDDVRVRQAFVHAVDREALVREAFQGQRLPATGGFVPPGMPGHSPGSGLAYDPDRARHLLKRAGLEAGRGFPAVDWLHPSGSEDERVIAFLQKAWHRTLGLDLQAQGLKWEALLEKLSHKSGHLMLLGWSAGYPDPDNFLRVVFHSREGIKGLRWHSARFDALVEEAARVTDQARRIDLYREADRILVVEEAAIMPLTYGQGRMLVKPRVSLPRTVSVTTRLIDVIVERAKL